MSLKYAEDSFKITYRYINNEIEMCVDKYLVISGFINSDEDYQNDTRPTLEQLLNYMSSKRYKYIGTSFRPNADFKDFIFENISK